MAMVAALFPSLSQVFPERFHHTWTRLHPASLREFLQPHPFVNTPPIDSQLPGDFTYTHPLRLHLLDRLKQLELLLALLLDHFQAVLDDPGGNLDLPRLLLTLPVRLRRRRGL